MAPLIPLTTIGAVVPYGICLDSQDCIWVAAKGGVFRFERSGLCIFYDKYERPKQISAFSSIRFLANEGKVLVKYADANGCFLALYDLEGTRLSTSILDSPIKSMAISERGDIFLTSQSLHKSELLRGHLDDLSTFETIDTSNEFQFEHLCCIPNKELLLVSCVRLPTNFYSEQTLKIIDYNGQIVSSFSRTGKEDGEINWPRAIEVNKKGNVIVLDKTGRLQEFDISKGKFERIVGVTPAHLANGFCIDENRNQFLITCSGLVANEENQGRVECDDWIECINY